MEKYQDKTDYSLLSLDNLTNLRKLKLQALKPCFRCRHYDKWHNDNGYKYRVYRFIAELRNINKILDNII